jgi:hypothetical protein
MNILRFSAEASLYKTSVQYGNSLSAFAHANTGMIPQHIFGPFCGRCFGHVKYCTDCPPGHYGCPYFTMPC